MPKQARSRQKVDAILAAIPRVLKREGYRGASTDKIALEAEVPVATLYQYFDDKDAVVRSYLQREFERLMTRVDRAGGARQVDSVREIIRSLVQAAVLFVSENREILTTATREVPSFLAQIPLAHAERRILDVATALSWALPGGAEKPDLRTPLFVISNAVMGFLLHTLGRFPEDMPPERVADELTTLIESYLAASGLAIDAAT